jgi:cation transport protein ChaC
MSRPVTLDQIDSEPGPLRVFAYGSLLWRPGFEYRRKQRAHLYGFHRALRVWSVHHRGTRDRPGLVLGLDRGGSCAGCVFEIDEDRKADVAAYLWDREMVTSVYAPRIVRVHLEDGTQRYTDSALCFLLDRDHDQYAGNLTNRDAAAVVRAAEGYSGHNREYVRETLRELKEVGIEDRGLAGVARLLEGEVD